MHKFLLLSLLLLTSCTSTPDPVFHTSHEPKKADAPFSDAVTAGPFLLLSGQIGMDHSTRTLVPGGIQEQTHRTIRNIEEVLDQHGRGLDDVVRCTVILSTIEDFAAFNEVYVQYFPHKPARTTFAASGLARNALIEIEVTAMAQ